MLYSLFFCLGFCVAILYLDLVFDVTTVPHRKTREALPASVLGPITTYYRYVTKNPWLLVFVMTVALTCIVTQLWLGLAPRWVVIASLIIFGLTALLAIARVIPGATRLASGKDGPEQQARLAHGMFVYHLIFLVLVLALVILQSCWARP